MASGFSTLLSQYCSDSSSENEEQGSGQQGLSTYFSAESIDDDRTWFSSRWSTASSQSPSESIYPPQDESQRLEGGDQSLKQAENDEGRILPSSRWCTASSQRPSETSLYQDEPRRLDGDQSIEQAENEDPKDTEAEKSDVSGHESPLKDGRSSTAYSLHTSEIPKDTRAFLDEVRKFYTKTVNMERQKDPLKPSTYKRVDERLRCYLQFASSRITTELTPDVFLRVNLIEQYLDFLKDERQISPATISNHAAALLYPAKLLNWDKYPDFTAVKIVRQLRSQVSFFQRMGDLKRPSTKEDLMSRNKWLDWPDVLKAVTLQRDRLDMARCSSAKARECSELLLMAIYTLMPPSRALEIRTLLVGDPSTDVSKTGKNTVHIDSNGTVKFRFEDYKTVTTYGADETVLEPTHELSHILKDFLKNYWHHCTNQHSEDHLFVNAAGKPFTSSSFSAHMKFLFRRVTGVPISINVLRSSFLTHAYSQKNCNDSAKDALASALRHSRRHAQGTYDKRTSHQRKELALELATEFAEKEEETTSKHNNLKAGDFVGLIEEASTTSKPLILIGQIQCFLKSGLARLLWYEEGRRGIYAFAFQEEPWEESVEAMVAVNMEVVRDRPGSFKLKTDQKVIHQLLSAEEK